MGKKIPIILSVLFFVCSITAQEMKRPPVWGIAKMTFLVSDLEIARDYYGRFLGFDEAFTYLSPLGTIVSFKVNDRQYLEFIVDKEAREKKRLVSLSLETESVKEMQLYLQSMGAETTKNTIDGAGNDVCMTQDVWGNNIEFIKFNNNGLHRKSKGKFLSKNRISKRIHHAGLYSGVIDEKDPFWVGIIKCRKIVRYPLNKSELWGVQYFDLLNCTENIEHYSPCDENFSHPCFLVEDMQETIYTLKERGGQKINQPAIGMTKRWLLNLVTPDNTKVEFTEPYCIK